MKTRVSTLTPSQEMRLLVGVVIQPFLAAAIGLVTFSIFLLDRDGRSLAGGSPVTTPDAAASVAVGVGLVAVLVTLIGGLPTALWLVKRQRVSLFTALAFGVGFGNFPFVLGALLAGTHGVAGFLRGVAFSSVVGASCAGVFWSIALREGPDDNQDAHGPH